MHIPESAPQQPPTKDFPYQDVFRLLIIFAGCASIIFSHYPTGFDFITLGVIAALATYLLVVRLLVHASGEKRQAVNRFFSYPDAAIVGALIAFLDFSLLPLVLFALLVQFNALLHGGMRKLAEDGVFMVIGMAVVMFLKGQSLTLKTDLETNIATLLAIGFYISLYALFSQRQTRALKQQLEALEQEKIKLKLNNYHISKYLSPTLRKAVSSGRNVKLETQRKKLTIFFSDIKGFSDLAEEMEADSLTALLNHYLTEMSEIALKYGGTIDKFIGDAIMVFFGDPSSKGVKADCVAATSMAIAMKKRMKELQLRWLNQGIQKPLEIRMGINTGFCTVGNFGTENRLDYTVLGTEVNLASRLESAAAPGEILISHEAYSLVKDVIMCRDQGEIKVKGYQQPIRVYSVVDLRKNLGKDQTYHEHATEGFSLYLDTDKIKNYDKEKVLKSLIQAAERLKKTTIN